jgi:hypothetical protein
MTFKLTKVKSFRSFVSYRHSVIKASPLIEVKKNIQIILKLFIFTLNSFVGSMSIIN